MKLIFSESAAMKHSPHRMRTRAVILMLLLLAMTGPRAILTAAEPDEARLNPNSNWENVSAAFTKEIGADNLEPAFLRHCTGLIVAPTGEIFMQTAKQGICLSRDQGATWSANINHKVTGRCEHAYGFSIAYPYDGRLAYFSYDGGDEAGEMSLDGGQTWKSFAPSHRGLEFADVDWSARDPQTILGVTHEPFFTVLSNDGGKSWQQLYKDDEGSRYVIYNVGVIGGTVLVRANANARTGQSDEPIGIIELSTDAGQTWSQTANYRATGRRPVHYGRNVYWVTSQGVIVTSNGKDWSLTGSGAEGALYGPYFGLSEREFIVGTSKAFLKTEDGGKSWKPVATFFKAPDLFRNAEGYCFFGWDAQNNILYSSGLGASIYRLKL